MPHHLHICLYQPEIPQNTGNIGRLTAATGNRLHLITPLGFRSDEKQLRRAGLDYWPYLDLEIHDSLDQALLQSHDFAFFSKKASRDYTEMPPSVDMCVFGKETSGLPDFLWQKYPDKFYSIPMFHPKVRSLNLANAVSIVVYHQLLKRRSFYGP